MFNHIVRKFDGNRDQITSHISSEFVQSWVGEKSEAYKETFNALVQSRCQALKGKKEALQAKIQSNLPEGSWQKEIGDRLDANQKKLKGMLSEPMDPILPKDGAYSVMEDSPKEKKNLTKRAIRAEMREKSQDFEEQACTPYGKEEFMRVSMIRDERSKSSLPMRKLMAETLFKGRIEDLSSKQQAYQAGDLSAEDFKISLDHYNQSLKEKGADGNVFDVEALLGEEVFQSLENPRQTLRQMVEREVNAQRFHQKPSVKVDDYHETDTLTPGKTGFTTKMSGSLDGIGSKELEAFSKVALVEGGAAECLRISIDFEDDPEERLDAQNDLNMELKVIMAYQENYRQGKLTRDEFRSVLELKNTVLKVMKGAKFDVFDVEALLGEEKSVPKSEASKSQKSSFPKILGERDVPKEEQDKIMDELEIGDDYDLREASREMLFDDTLPSIMGGTRKDVLIEPEATIPINLQTNVDDYTETTTTTPGKTETTTRISGSISGLSYEERQAFEKQAFTTGGKEAALKAFEGKREGRSAQYSSFKKHTAKRLFKMSVNALLMKKEAYKSGKMSEESFRESVERDNRSFRRRGATIDVFDVEALLGEEKETLKPIIAQSEEVIHPKRKPSVAEKQAPVEKVLVEVGGYRETEIQTKTGPQIRRDIKGFVSPEERKEFEALAVTEEGEAEFMRVHSKPVEGQKASATVLEAIRAFRSCMMRFSLEYVSYKKGDMPKERFRESLERENADLFQRGATVRVFDVDALLKRDEVD